MGLLVLLKPIAPSSSSPPVSVNLKPVSPRTVKLESTLFSLSPSVSNNSSLVSTRWTTPSQNTAKIDTKRSSRKSATTSRKSVTTRKPLLSSQSRAGTETTLSKPPPTCLGTRDGAKRPKRAVKNPAKLSSKLWTPSTSQFDHPTTSVSTSRTSPSKTSDEVTFAPTPNKTQPSS